MDSYDAYYHQYVTQEQIDAYNAQFIPQKPVDECVAIDPSMTYNEEYFWNQVHNSIPGVMDHQAVLVVNPEQMVVPTDLWQQQVNYSNASNMQQYESWTSQPGPVYSYQPENYPHMNYTELENHNQLQTMSPPMTISPNYSSYTNQFPQSWGSNLSTTPPNEYHSSGSDGGSDDIHSQIPLNYSSAPPSGQWQPTPIPITPELQEEIEPEPSPEVGKQSYYRPRHLQNVSNIARSLVREEGALPPRNRAPVLSIITKKKKACTSCKRRKISCAPPTVGVKCNQCQRTGSECDIE